jgi:hypothetical protein
MKLGLKLISVRKPIGIFTWHEEDIAKRLGSHRETALSDVNRKSLHMRATKLIFRVKHLLQGGLMRHQHLSFELVSGNHQAQSRRIERPNLGL